MSPTMSRAEIERAQFNRLQRLLTEILPANRFYAAKLSEAGITSASDLRGLDDLVRLPFTTKAELSEDQATHAPFGTNLSVPETSFVRMHQTSGTSGAPLRWLDTAESWQWWIRCWRDVLANAGVTPSDRLFFAFSFGPFIGFWSAWAASEAHGCLTLSGGAMSTEQRLRAIVDSRATVVLSTPTYALHLGSEALRLGIDLPASSVHTTIHAGEPGAGIAATRARIESLWGARCFDHAGATEVGAWGYECSQRSGLHMNEGEFLFEVIGPGGQPAQEGELVVTNLGRGCMPVIRYRTGDHVRLDARACECGSAYRRCSGGVLGRVDDAVIVRGVNLFPSAIEAIIREVTPAEEFQIELTRRSELDEVRLKIEATSDAAERVAREMSVRFGLRASVEAVPVGSLPRSEMKARRVVDRRRLAP